MIRLKFIVQWTLHGEGAAFQHAGLDHGGLDGFVGNEIEYGGNPPAFLNHIDGISVVIVAKSAGGPP
jgi:hypothetical protein